MTPKEVAHCADTGAREQEVQGFLTGASARDLQEFCHCLQAGAHSRHFPLARIALDVRLAEDADRRAGMLQQQVEKLVGIADVQRVLAEKLERQTNKIIVLTRLLVVFTIVLIILTIALIMRGG